VCVKSRCVALAGAPTLTQIQNCSKNAPPPAVRKALGGSPDGVWNDPGDPLSVNRPPSGSKPPKDGRLPALEMPPMGVDPPAMDGGAWGDYMESARTMGLGATHNSDFFGQTSNSIFGSTRRSLTLPAATFVLRCAQLFLAPGSPAFACPLPSAWSTPLTLVIPCVLWQAFPRCSAPSESRRRRHTAWSL